MRELVSYNYGKLYIDVQRPALFESLLGALHDVSMNVARLAICLVWLCAEIVSANDYQERLLLQPLAPASVLASFNFRSNASLSSFERQNFGHFPRSLGQILQHAKTKELHLRFSTGRWDAESWGTRPWGGAKEGGTGVELWAWVEADDDEEAFARWITLNNALSGLFCASMNFIDSTRTTRPVMTFEPMGDHTNQSMQNLHLLHGTLPREVVCTENLTPFLKLLPCKGAAGIGSLLDGHKLFDATWQTMSVDVRPLCPAGEPECVVEIDQTVDMVLDIERSKRPRDSPIPRPLPVPALHCDKERQYPSEEYCFPRDLSRSQHWSLATLYSKIIRGPCNASASKPTDPTVCINIPHDLEVYATEGAVEVKDDGGFSRCFWMAPDRDFGLFVPDSDPPKVNPVTRPPLFAERSITGHGQERGGVRALLTNPSPDTAVEFVYFETLPWFMKPYLHTLSAKVTSGPPTDLDVIKDMYYRPGLDRVRGSQLELHLAIPPGATVTLTYAFEKAILRYTEYPPDANRGRDVAPAVIRVIRGDTPASPGRTPRASGGPGAAYLRTTPLMLPLPTPDFSMPYNVIILTSTVMALAFGMVYNMLVRRFVGADEGEEQGVPALVRGVLRAALRRLRARVAPPRAAEKKTQ